MQDSRKVIVSKQYNSNNGVFRILCVPVGANDDWSSTLKLIDSKTELQDMQRAVSVIRMGDQPSEADLGGQDSTRTKEDEIEAPGFEGLGQLILQMLARYRIDNVVIAVLVNGFSILKAVTERNFEAICSRLKEFLLELYSSLVEFKIINVQPNDLATFKHFDLPLPPESAQERKARLRVSKFKETGFKAPVIAQAKRERPNHVFGDQVHEPQKEHVVDPLYVQKQVIENSLRVKAQEIERLALSLEDPDFSQIKALGKFHNYDVVKKVFQMLMILNNIDSERDVQEFMADFDIRGFVRFGNVNMVSPEKMDTVSSLLKNSPGLNVETVKSFSKKFCVLFQFMVGLIKCYDLNLRYALILHQLEEKRSLNKSRSENVLLTNPQLDGITSVRSGLRRVTGLPVNLQQYGFPGLPPPKPPRHKEPYFTRDIRTKYEKLR